jgi:hypothetical protein
MRRSFPQKRAEAAERPQVAHARGGLAQAKRLGGLAIGTLLEVAEQDDLAIDVIETEQNRVKPALELMPDRQRRRREARVAKLGGEIERGLIDERRAGPREMQPAFAVDTAPG